MASDSIRSARESLLEEQREIRSQIGDLEARGRELDKAVASLDTLLGGRRRGPGRPPGRLGRPPGRPPGSGKPGPKPGRSASGRAPRGAIAAGIEEFLTGKGRQAVHGSEILAALEERGVAPQGAFPKASLLNTLQRLEKQGKVRNIGRNRWRKLTQ